MHVYTIRAKITLNPVRQHKLSQKLRGEHPLKITCPHFSSKWHPRIGLLLRDRRFLLHRVSGKSLEKDLAFYPYRENSVLCLCYQVLYDPLKRVERDVAARVRSRRRLICPDDRSVSSKRDINGMKLHRF